MARDAVIVSTARTPIGRAYKGAFNATPGATLGALSLAPAIERAGIEAGAIDDVVWGAVLTQGTQAGNIGRQVALRAGCPVTVSAQTIDRQCSSGLMAIATAAKQIIVDNMDIVVGGGQDSISMVQTPEMRVSPDRSLIAMHKDVYMPMLGTAETVAKRYGISREAQDEYAFQSQMRTAAAQAAGYLDIAMENRLSKILYTIANNELVIIDSYPSIIYDLDDAEELSRTEREEKKLIEIIKVANSSKCAVGIILHVTKSGTYKGSTTVQHAVDINISILRDEERPDVRIIDFTKNRMGCAASYEYYFGVAGYDFHKQVEMLQEDEQPARGGARSNARIEQMQAVMSMDEPPHINVQRVCNELHIDAQRATYLLWLLVKEGKLEKFGRGENAVWKVAIKMQNVVAFA